MAIMQNFKCTMCHQKVSESVPNTVIRTVCTTCATMIQEGQRASSLGQLKTLPLEERVSRIEAWIYEHKDCIDAVSMLLITKV